MKVFDFGEFEMGTESTKAVMMLKYELYIEIQLMYIIFHKLLFK